MTSPPFKIGYVLIEQNQVYDEVTQRIAGVTLSKEQAETWCDQASLHTGVFNRYMIPVQLVEE